MCCVLCVAVCCVLCVTVCSVLCVTVCSALCFTVCSAQCVVYCVLQCVVYCVLCTVCCSVLCTVCCSVLRTVCCRMFVVQYVPESNLVLVVTQADCDCSRQYGAILLEPKEIKYILLTPDPADPLLLFVWHTLHHFIPKTRL